MDVTIDTSVIENLSSNGVLAYIAVKIAEGSEATTAALAGLVRCKTGNMLDGLKDVAVAAPELVAKAPKNRWRCGVVKAGEGVVLQNLESETDRRKELLDDLKAAFEWANPGLTFTMDGADGQAVNKFLRQYRDWTRPMWKRALFNRYMSEGIVTSQPLHRWLGLLVEYAATPLDRYGKAMVNGGGKIGKAVAVEQSNRAARESVLNGTR